ncbi:MAG: DUF308 domain-containing protein [Microthrixaceae bacterium]
MSDQMDIKQVNVEVRGLPKFAWLIWVVAGAVSSVVGFWLLLSPKVAIATLAILVAIGLIFNGIGEIATAAQSRYPVVNYIIGVVFVVAGLMVFLRPSGPTAALNFLALLVGFTMILTGIGEMVVAFVGRNEIEHWLVLAFMGAMGIIAGFMAASWPAITVFVLAVLLGVRLLFVGIAQIGLGLKIKSLTA